MKDVSKRSILKIESFVKLDLCNIHIFIEFNYFINLNLVISCCQICAFYFYDLILQLKYPKYLYLYCFNDIVML